MGKQAAFLFGSGISIPSRLPSVYDISKAALSGDWHHHTDQNFYPGLHPGSSTIDPATAAVKEFLTRVNACAADYLADVSRYRVSRRPHYEDWFSLVEQASRSEIDHVPNLATVDFLRRLRSETASVHCGFSKGIIGRDGFGQLAEMTCDFLHWVVHHSLKNVAAPRQGLKVISEVAGSVDALDIFTLNHDLLVETQLREDGISDLEEGFDDRTRGKCSVFSGWPSDRRKKVRLLKLHGSLNWYLYDFPGWARQYAIPDADSKYCKDIAGRMLYPVEGKAAFLTGTIVKEQRYGIGFWGELFSNFGSHLSKHTHLICSGYGFGDPGINQRLAQWMNDRLDGTNRLVILTPRSADDFLENKPYWLARLHGEGRARFVQSHLESCRIDELKEFFDPL